jgi:transposase
MSTTHSQFPDDLASCQALIGQLQAENQHLREQVAERESEAKKLASRARHLEALLDEHRETVVDQQRTIENLTADNKLLKRSLFGSRRERYEDPAQGLLFDIQPLKAEAEEAQKQAEKPEKSTKPPRKRNSKGRQRRVIPDFLPREERRHFLNEEDIPEEMRNHPDARRFFKKVGEQIELVPLQLKVIEEYQEVIVLDQPDATTTVISAKRPPSPIRSFAAPSLLAYLTVSRFADHLPYYRLEDILGRSGLRIERSTQWRWMRRLAVSVTPLVDLMWDLALQSAVIGMDETPVKELGGVGTTLTGYLWTGVGDAQHPYDCFFYTSDRRTIRPETFLARFQGYLLADAYIAYERIGQLRPEIVNASCWSHARRKFEACHHLGPTDLTHTALAYFRQLFDIEDRYRQSSAAERLARRREQSQPLVNAFHDWLQNEQARQLPKAKLSGAINYMLTRWDSFTRFLECGLVPMDNNGAERALKYPILGRKAWLFVGNREAGETAAKLFTLTKTCNRLHIDPLAYLRDLYTRLPTTPVDQLFSLLPDRWLAEHPQHLIPERVQEAIERAQRARERRAERRRAAA